MSVFLWQVWLFCSWFSSLMWKKQSTSSSGFFLLVLVLDPKDALLFSHCICIPHHLWFWFILLEPKRDSFWFLKKEGQPLSPLVTNFSLAINKTSLFVTLQVKQFSGKQTWKELDWREVNLIVRCCSAREPLSLSFCFSTRFQDWSIAVQTLTPLFQKPRLFFFWRRKLEMRVMSPSFYWKVWNSKLSLRIVNQHEEGRKE
jgi:hypothetical protein